MAYLLGYGSAVEWLRQNRDMQRLRRRLNVPYSQLEGSRTRLELHKSELADLTRPIQLIVFGRNNRRRSAIADCHALSTQTGRYPAIYVGPDLYCSAPGFAFVQMATKLDDERLVFLGMELCGRFGLTAQGTLFHREQTRMPQTLINQARALPNTHGRIKALEIAARIVGGSASPMETALALTLSMPRSEGGYGLEPPELNRALPVEGKTRVIWYEDHITPDLLWKKEKLIIEYDSDLHHTASSRIASDAERRDVFEELGYRVITVTSEHMRTPRQLERIAGIVADRLGTSLEPADAKEHGVRLAFQARMRHIATHPEELLALPKAKPTLRDWHVRHGR